MHEHRRAGDDAAGLLRRRRARGGAAAGEPQFAFVGFRRQQLGAFGGHARVGVGQEAGVGERFTDELVNQAGALGLGRGERDGVGRIAGLRADERALVEGAVEERERADAAALGLVGADQAGAVPVQVKGADVLTGGVLAADPCKPAVVRPVAGGGVHRPEGFGRLKGGRVGADDDAVLEVAQPEAGAGARLARFGDRPELVRPGPGDPRDFAGAAADGRQLVPVAAVVEEQAGGHDRVALDAEQTLVGGIELHVVGGAEGNLEGRAGRRRRLFQPPARFGAGRAGERQACDEGDEHRRDREPRQRGLHCDPPVATTPSPGAPPPTQPLRPGARWSVKVCAPGLARARIEGRGRSWAGSRARRDPARGGARPAVPRG